MEYVYGCYIGAVIAEGIVTTEHQKPEALGSFSSSGP